MKKNISLEILMWIKKILIVLESIKSQLHLNYDREMLRRPECQTRKGMERNV